MAEALMRSGEAVPWRLELDLRGSDPRGWRLRG